MVDKDAPVYATSGITIAASPEIVWDVMSAIEDWPQWNPDVKEARLEGPVAEGFVFRWKAGPGRITSTLVVVDPPREIGWTGTTLGVRAEHVWRLEARNGGCAVTTEESWDGPLVRVFRRWSQRTVEKALRDGSAHLKAEAERRAGVSS